MCAYLPLPEMFHELGASTLGSCGKSDSGNRKKKVISIFLRFEAFECLHKTSELKHISLIEVYSSQLLNNFLFKIEKYFFFQVAKQN